MASSALHHRYVVVLGVEDRLPPGCRLGSVSITVTISIPGVCRARTAGGSSRSEYESAGRELDDLGVETRLLPKLASCRDGRRLTGLDLTSHETPVPKPLGSPAKDAGTRLRAGRRPRPRYLPSSNRAPS